MNDNPSTSPSGEPPLAAQEDFQEVDPQVCPERRHSRTDSELPSDGNSAMSVPDVKIAPHPQPNLRVKYV